MAWTIRFTATAHKQLKRLDRGAQARIRDYLRQRLATADDPRRFGAPLRGELFGFWKYRIGDHRVIAEIRQGELIVLVLRVAHRRRVCGGH